MIENTNVYAYCRRTLGNEKDWDEILESLDAVFHLGLIGVRPFRGNDLMNSFSWQHAAVVHPEGEDYWIGLYERALDNEH